MVPPVANEREALLAYLDHQRTVIRIAAYGLTDAQARQAPTVSPLTIGGLLKHVAAVEHHWMQLVTGTGGGGSQENYEDNFRLADNETLDDVLERYGQIAKDTEATIADLDLDHPVPVPKGVPWFPDDIDAWSVRWVLLHLIQETARHAGHADIVREAIDGATAFPLMAAAEHWPATPWMQPWVKPE
jgi:uncharacterized damage-inducible protein DinB